MSNLIGCAIITDRMEDYAMPGLIEIYAKLPFQRLSSFDRLRMMDFL